MAGYQGGNYNAYSNQGYGNSNNYNTTAYGATGGEGGGGFMNGSQGGGSSQKKDNPNKDTLRPSTILQVMNASQPYPEADFLIDGSEIDRVSIVGQVRNVNPQATNITYLLDDGTGTIDVKKWQAESHGYGDGGDGTEDGGPSPSTIEIGQWARVIGSLKQFNNRRHIGALSIRSVPDMNEVNYHLLDATATHLYYTRGPPKDTGAANGAKGEDSLFMQQGDGGGMGAQRFGPRLTPNAERVVEALRTQPSSNEGLHVQNIAVLTGLKINDVMKAGDELMQQSVIFTTTDDNTWALLDGA